MKNKKLFAILTLVCFMFTLMPVAAFAAPSDYTVQVKVGSGVYTEDVYVTAGTTMSVLAFDASNVALAKGAYYAVNADGEGVQIKYDNEGDGEVFKFTVPGTYTIYGVEDATGLNTLVSNANNLANEQTVANAVEKIKAQLDDKIIKSVASVTVEAPDSDYVVKVDGATTAAVTVVADNGFSAAGNATVTVNLTNNTKAVVGKVPTITAPDYVTVVPADAKKTVTNAAGNIAYNISANRGGTFKVVFSYEDADDAVVTVTATDSKVGSVEVVKEATKLINNKKNSSGEVRTGAALEFTDANGSVKSITGTSTTGSAMTAVKFTVVSQPTGSRLTAANFELVPSATVAGASELKVIGLTSDLRVGTYEVKVALENGKSATVAFETAKMGTKVGIRFVQPAKTVALGATGMPAFTVQAYDANGVTEALTPGTDYTVSYSGKAYVGPGVATDDKYIGSTISVLAKTNDDKFVATTTLEVVDGDMALVYQKTSAEVGVTTQLKVNVVDVKGNKVVFNAGAPTTVNFVVLEKPAKAYVSANATLAAGAKDFSVDFLASVAGEYTIQTIIVNGTEYVTSIDTITVGGNEANSFKDVVVLSIGANNLVVNSDVKAIPAAPMIKDGRTFVPFRALSEAFGAEVAWDEATQSVTAELNGVKVVLTIGSNVYTVNGVAKVADVAAFIAGDGYTMVPVRFVAEAFGINVTPIYAADGSVADVLFAK